MTSGRRTDRELTVECSRIRKVLRKVAQCMPRPREYRCDVRCDIWTFRRGTRSGEGCTSLVRQTASRMAVGERRSGSSGHESRHVREHSETGPVLAMSTPADSNPDDARPACLHHE